MSNTMSSGFRGYRAAMQFQGFERELFNAQMIIAMQERYNQQAYYRDATAPSRKYEPLVYGKFKKA